MITRQELEGKWNDVKGRVQERWGEITDDELQQVRGNTNQLVGVIQQKSGEARSAIEDFLEEVVTGDANAAKRVAETAREYAEKASDAFHEQFGQVSDSVRTGYEQAEGMVRRKPVESVAVAFGAGIITGVVVGLVLKSR